MSRIRPLAPIDRQVRSQASKPAGHGRDGFVAPEYETAAQPQPFVQLPSKAVLQRLVEIGEDHVAAKDQVERADLAVLDSMGKGLSSPEIASEAARLASDWFDTHLRGELEG